MKSLRSRVAIALFVLCLGTPQQGLAQSAAECSPRTYKSLVKKELKLAKKELSITKKLNKLNAKPCSPRRLKQCERKKAKTKELLVATQIKKTQVAAVREGCESNNNGGSQFITGNSSGVRVGQVNFEMGEPGRFIGTVNVPIPAPLSRFVRNQSQYVFAIEDTNAPGGLRYAEPETKAFHHLRDGATPRIITLRIPITNDPATEQVISRAVRIVPAQEITIPSFELTPFAQSFWERGGVEVNLPGVNAGWSGEIAIRNCEPEFDGPYTRRFSCAMKLQPDARGIISALSATVTVTFESGSALPRLSLLLSNSNILGSFHTPVISGSMKAVLDGQTLPIEVHNIQFPGISTPHYRHQVVNNEYFFIPPIAGQVNAISEDAIYPFPDAVVYGSGSTQTEARHEALATHDGIMQSERGADALPLYTNWTEAALPLAALPIASELYSPTELAQRAAEIRTRIFNDHTGRRGDAFGLDSVDPTFFTYFAGPNSLSMAGGVGLQRINEALTLAASLRAPGLRFVIEGIQAHMYAFYSRWPISVMYDEQGQVMSSAEILARANGRAVHTGSEWRIHPSSYFNPNRDRRSDPAVQALISEALTAPYAPITIGYYDSNNGFHGVYNGGADRQHSIRGYMPAVASCFIVPSPQCERLQELLGNAIVAFRIDPRNLDNLGNFYEANKRQADADAANGVFGSILGRDLTDTMYLNLRLMKTASLDEFLFVQNPGTPAAHNVTVADRIKLLLSIINVSTSGRNLFATTDRIDGRDFASEAQAIEITQFACSFYGLSDCQDTFYLMTDADARAQFCHDEPDPNNPGRTILVCNWPAPHNGYPSSARVTLLNREGIKRQGYWEGVYTLGEIGSLVSIVRDVPELQLTVLPTINEIREHLTFFNDSCDGTNSPDRCAVNSEGKYGWIGFVGRPANPFPPAAIHSFTSYSDSAFYYMLMSVVEHSLNFETSAANGFQSFGLVFPRVVSYSRSDVFDQWRATTMALFQQQRFTFGFPGR